MAIVVKDRVKVTTSTTGTGTLTLGSAESGFQAFSVIGNGNQTYYAIKSDAGFEVGIGTYTHSGTTLSRDTILESSNSGSAVSLTGTSTVFTTYPAERSSFRNVGVARDYVASGSITAGKPLILNTDNTVTQVTGSTTTTDTGSLTQFETGSIEGVSSAYDSSNDRVVVAYRDISNSGYGTAVVGSVSDFTITFGTPVVFESASTNTTTTVFDSSNNKIVISYQDTDNSKKGTSIVGTVSGTSISFGSPVIFANADTRVINSCFDSSNNKVVIAFRDQDNSQQGTAIVGTVSSTSISFGSETVFESGNTAYIEPVFDSNENKVVIFFSDEDFLYYPKAIVGTVSSTSISFGSPVTINSAGATSMSAVFDTSTNKTVCAFSGSGGNKGAVGTVSGTSISFGTLVTIAGSGTNSMKQHNASFDSANNKSVFVYTDSYNDTKATRIFATVTGTDVSFSSATVVVNEASSNYFATCFDNTSNKFITSAGLPTTGGGSAIVYSTVDVTVTNLTNDNYFGIASSSASDTEAVGVNRPGSINIDQTGLTAGKNYYVKSDGTIVERTTTVGSTTTVNASQFVGTARSSTDLELLEPPIELVGTADGSITKGKPVILKTDGDIQQVGAISTSVSYSAGTSSVLDDDTIFTNAVTYDSDKNYFVAFYQEQNSSNYGYARTFTVSGKAITMVQSLGAFHTNTTEIVDACYIGNSKHIVFWRDNNAYLQARVVEIASDGTGTFGTANTIYSNTFYRNGSCYYDSDKDVAVITGMATSSYNVSAQACTVSGTDITAGTMQSNGEQPGYSGTSSSYDSGQKIGLVAFETAYGSDTDLATISLSGTGNRTVTWNARVEVNSNGAELSNDGMAYDPVSQKHLLCFNDDADNYLKGIVISVSGTTPSFGTEATINSGQVNRTFACGSTNQGGFTIAWRDHSSPYYLKGVVATISGTSFNLTNSATLDSRAIKEDPNVSVAYQPSDFTNVVAYVDNTDTELYGVCVIPEGTADSFNLTDSNFIGFAQQTVSDNEDLKVATIGQTDDNQSSITPVSKYYVQQDGTLSTTADNPSVLGGTALSSTKILIKS